MAPVATARLNNIVWKLHEQRGRNAELIELECDVLVPCALEQVINADNAARVQARGAVGGRGEESGRAAAKRSPVVVVFVLVLVESASASLSEYL